MNSMHIEVEKFATYSQVTITDQRGNTWVINAPRETAGEIGVRLTSGRMDGLVVEPHSETSLTLRVR